MVVAGFRRSISLPGRNSSSGGGKVFPAKPQPIRSSSFPDRRSSPGTSKLEEDLHKAEIWRSTENPLSSSFLASGLIHLEALHLSLAEFLDLPQNQEKLNRSPKIAENLLEDLLLLADAHGSFRLAVISLQELQSAAEIALRRKDGDFLAGLGRQFKKTEKEITALAASLERAESDLLLPDSDLDVILRDVKSVSFSISAAVIRGAAAAVSLSTAVLKCKSSSWNSLRRRNLPPIASPTSNGALTAALTDLGECLTALEIPCQKIFSCLVNSRVSVLNILTQTS